MGKSLIIPESDFSQNCISETDVWYTNDASNNQNLLISLFQNSVYTSEYISDSVKGKKINAIKVPKCQTGQITLYLANYPESGINPELRLVETINVTNLNEPQQILLNNTISLTNN